jgi:hypothetical protein
MTSAAGQPPTFTFAARIDLTEVRDLLDSLDPSPRG